MSYIIITPVKNEQEYIEQTLISVMGQKLLPLRWVIVNDNSVDNTVEIIMKYIKDKNWIKLIDYKQDRTERIGGAKVVKVFNEGYRHVKDIDFDFLVKLDADLSLPDNYFEEINKAFFANSKLGLTGGYCLNIIDGKFKREKSSSYHIRGAFKSIRKECFEDINGFKPIWHWDGVDEMHAMSLGWETKTLDLPVIHLRPTSMAYDPLKHSYLSGFESYKMGSNLFLTFVRVASRMKNKPYIIASLFYLRGYFKAMISKESKHLNKDLIQFINDFHLKRLMRGLRL